MAFFHAAIPTHWLPFVATGRAQRWSHAKTLMVAVAAGTGHVGITALLGFLLTAFGVAMSARVGSWFPWIAASLLAGLGLFYIGRQLTGHSHSHTHLFCGHGGERIGCRHDHADLKTSQLKEALGHLRAPDVSPSRTSDRVAILTLLGLLTFSPCEGFLPIYVSGIRFGWGGFALLTLILSVATVAGMLLFTSLALAGIRNLRVAWFERFESGIMGALLLFIGALVIALEH